MRFGRTSIGVAVALLCGGASSGTATTWYIKADGSGDAPTIQAAIDAAANGDTVLVAAGTYTGPGNVDVLFRGAEIVVTSESGPASTVIDCAGSARGFRFDDDEGPNAILSGLTIRNGFSDGKGGGIFCNKASPQIVNNVIVDSHADKEGGGIYINKGSPTIMNNTIVGNSATVDGGGIAVNATATPLVAQNVIAFSTQGAGITCTGRGVNPTLTCNDIFGNAGGDGLCGTDGGGNISEDPQFCGALGSGNYYIQSDSPLAAQNSACGQRIGALDVFCAQVSSEEGTWGSIKSLYR